MAKYSVEVRDQYGKLVTVINRPMNKEFAIYRNKPGYLQFVMDGFDPQAIDTYLKLNQYDIVFRRLGTPIVGGQISYINPKVDGDKAQVDIVANGYLDLLQQRMVSAAFPNFDTIKQELVFGDTDGGTVVDTLVQYAQFPISTDASYNIQAASPNICQSFIATGSSTVTTLKLLMQQSGTPTGSLVVEIFTDNQGVPSNTAVANSQKTIAVSTVSSSSFAWLNIAYTGTLPILVQGQTYWIKVHTDTSQSGSNGILWGYMNNNYYYSGRAFSPESPSLFTSDQDMQFFIQLSDNSFQMTKNTYMNLQRGTVQTSFNINRTFPIYKRIKEAIEEITKLNSGVDFNVALSIDSNNLMTKTYNVFYPRQGVDNTDLNFSYPGNIIKVGKSRDGKSMLNTAYTRGQGTGIYQAVAISPDPTSIQTYGLREDVEDFSDVPDPTTLQSLGDELIRVRKDPLEIPEITLDGNIDPQVGSYGLGDTILVNILGPGLLNFIQTYRIEEIHVTIDDDDVERVELSISKA